MKKKNQLKFIFYQFIFVHFCFSWHSFDTMGQTHSDPHDHHNFLTATQLENLSKKESSLTLAQRRSRYVYLFFLSKNIYPF